MTFRSRRRPRCTSQLPRRWVRAGRLLLIINAIVLVLSSFTEHFWTWDRFLRGGQDFELSVLALIAFFCLILVLADHFSRAVRDRLAHRSGHAVARDLTAFTLPAAPSLFVPSSERPPGERSLAILSCTVLRI
ncbi:MAG TPA: hypothetical protein VGM11_05075 [Acidobacteriaceae bacterium]